VKNSCKSFFDVTLSLFVFTASLALNITDDEKAPCRDPCDETGVDITGQENCTQAQFCHWDAQNSACWSKKGTM